MVEDRGTEDSLRDMTKILFLKPEERGDEYETFLTQKSHAQFQHGFTPSFFPAEAFDFQAALIEWSVKKGRAAIFADCGLGKTIIQLAWAENVVRRTNKPVLLLTPLAVSFQTIKEAEKFNIDAVRSSDGSFTGTRIVVTNYERLHHFDPSLFAGVICDESSILKSFEGKTRLVVTEFMKKLPYRLLCTATPSPNDFIELGTSSEALGNLGYTDMLTRFFKNDQNVIKPMIYRNKGKNVALADEKGKWRLKGHAELPFWRWVCSWARALRKPSDIGFQDDRFLLPPLEEREHIVAIDTPPEGMLFSLPAVGLTEQRQERRRTLDARCELVASLTFSKPSSLVWCHLNDEGDLLERLIPGSVQVSGKDTDETKEEKFLAFQTGQIAMLITKPVIGAWGLNFQHCTHMAFFPSHSYEQYYQGVRRCWRFGQTRPVTVDIVTTKGEQNVLANLQRKNQQAERMFDNLVREMTRAETIALSSFTAQEEIPSWLS